MISPADLKARFPEFGEEEDARIQIFINDAKSMSYMGEDEVRWGTQYDYAAVHLSAHLLAIGNASRDGDQSAKAGNVSSSSVGSVSVSYTVGDRDAGDDFYRSTTYGMTYMEVRKQNFIGMVVTGDVESIEGISPRSF